jgi:hypothetical protein
MIQREYSKETLLGQCNTYTERSMGVDCTAVCLEGVPESALNAPEVVQSIPEFLGFWKLLQNKVWGCGGTPERHREHGK